VAAVFSLDVEKGISGVGARCVIHRNHDKLFSRLHAVKPG
jgi:hypothetical protein